ncbi:MAG: toll/interleukin-1 receptor domain-containing protein [Nannocystaceae bacterium]
MARKYRVFLSYNSRDFEVVEKVARWLRDDCKLMPFFDRWHLVAGKPIQPALEHAISRSDAVAVFFGPQSKGPHQELEAQLAIAQSAVDAGKRTFAVLLPRAKKDAVQGFIKVRLWVDVRDRHWYVSFLSGVLDREPMEVEELFTSPPKLGFGARTWRAIRGALGGARSELETPPAPAFRAPTLDDEFAGDSSEFLEAAAVESSPSPRVARSSPPTAERGTPHASKPRAERESEDDWEAIPALHAVLERGPRELVTALDQELSVTVEPATPLSRQVAAKIDALGRGPQATRELCYACHRAWGVVDRRRSAEGGPALETVRGLVSEWLPRRYGSTGRIRRIQRLGSAHDNAVEDLEIATDSDLVTDLHVAAEDRKPLDVHTRERAGDDGKPVSWIVGRRSMPVPSALGSTIGSAIAAASEIADGYAGQFPGQHDGTEPGKRKFALDRLAFMRQGGRGGPQYLATRDGEVPPEVLDLLKTIYPPLRLVLRTGILDDDEAKILQPLVEIFLDATCEEWKPR